MKIQTRLIVLLGVVLTMFGLSLWSLHQSHESESRRLLDQTITERAALLERVLELTGDSLRNFSRDYTQWSEMADFVKHGNPEWGRVNLAASLPNFGVHAVWVLRPDGTGVYHTQREGDGPSLELPAPNEVLAEQLPIWRFGHFYQRTPAGLYEIRTAPIHLSEDAAREGEPLGWFIAARRWDEAHLGTLGSVLGSEVWLEHPHTTPTHHAQLVIHRELTDWMGKEEAVLHTRQDAAALRLITRQNEFEIRMFIYFGAAMLCLAVVGLSRWVVRPLRQLEQSLVTGSAAPLGTLRGQPDEFGRLAELVGDSFTQRGNLEREIEDRRRAEAALRQSREEVRYAAELKSRLARDLHDGVIQSIYAAGLGLEGVRSLLRADPEMAGRRLDATQNSLNQTIREVRSFIQGLEPEEGERPEFAQVLRSLIETLQALHPVELPLHVDLPTIKLSPREEVHALQIIRECVSNALRHGEARRIEVRLTEEGHRAVLRIRDDGRGFDPQQGRSSGGSGLANLASRVTEIGATLDLRSAPGKGTDITIRFLHPSVTA